MPEPCRRRPSWRRARPRRRANELGGAAPSLALFLRPTGLAAGLALKELRFLRGGRIRPNYRFPRSHRAAGGIRRACKNAAEDKTPVRRPPTGGSGPRPPTPPPP